MTTICFIRPPKPDSGIQDESHPLCQKGQRRLLILKLKTFQRLQNSNGMIFPINWKTENVYRKSKNETL